MSQRRPSCLALAAVLAAWPLLAAADTPPADRNGDDAQRLDACVKPAPAAPTEDGTPAAPRPAPPPECSTAAPSSPDRPRPGQAAPPVDPGRAAERHGHEAAANAAAQNGARTLLGSLLRGEGGPATAAGGALPPGAGPGDLHALSQTPQAQSPYANTLRTGEVPAGGGHQDHDLHAMGDSAIAPAPTLWARAASAASRSGPVVAQDLATLRAHLDSFQLPPNASGLASSDAPLASFVAWARTAKPDQLPSVSYGILSEGELGRYSPGMLGGPGSITLNHYIKDMPADERSVVLFHELYHYWDNKVERLHYANVSYGYIDPAHMPEHEYDAYYMTALYWQQAKKEGASSRLAQFLDKLPSDPAEVRAMVDRTVAGHK